MRIGINSTQIFDPLDHTVVLRLGVQNRSISQTQKQLDKNKSGFPMFITNLRSANARKNALPQTPRWTTTLAGWLRPRSICGRLELIRNYGHCNSLHTRTHSKHNNVALFSCRGNLSLQLGFLTRALFFSPHQPCGARSGSRDFARTQQAMD